MWPHGDYPLIEVGRMTLNKNPEDYFIHIEQAAFEPSNLVPGIGPSPDKMLLGRLFSYPDTHRYRIGPNYAQLPPNRPHVPGPLVREGRPDAVRAVADAARPYAPNSLRRPGGGHRALRGPGGLGDRRARWCARPTRCAARTTTAASRARWSARSSTTRPATGSWATSPAICWTASASPVLDRALQYWRNIDKNVGDRIAHKVNGG